MGERNSRWAQVELFVPSMFITCSMDATLEQGRSDKDPSKNENRLARWNFVVSENTIKM